MNHFLCDTAAIHAKLDEIIMSMRETRNEVIGLEHEQPEHIAAAVERLEAEADYQDRAARREDTASAETCS